MADSRLAGTRVIQVLVEGSAPDAIKNPEVIKRMDPLGTFIAHQPLPVGKVVSIVDLLRQMSLAVDSNGGGKLPDTAQGVAQYLLLYTMGGDEEDLSRFVDRPFQNAVITAYLKTDDFRAMKAMTVADARPRPTASSRGCRSPRAWAAASPTPSPSTRRWSTARPSTSSRSRSWSW